MAGDTFDAGTVYAEARLGRDEFQRDLKQLYRDMERFERRQWSTKVGMDARENEREERTVRGRMRNLNREKANPAVGLNTRSFFRSLFSVRAALKQINEIVSTPTILVEIGQSLLRVAQLKYELRDLAGRYIVDVVVYPQAFREINKISGALLSMRNIARTAVPVLMPLLGGIAGGANITAASLVGAAGAMGVFALAAVPGLTQIAEKWTEVDKAAKKVREAKTEEDRTKALQEYRDMMSSVSAQEKAALDNITLIVQAWRDFQTAVQPAVFGVMANSVSLIQKLLPPLIPVVEAVARVINGWIDSMERGVDSGGFAKFTTWLAGPGVQSLDTWGRAIGNLGVGFINMMMGTQPYVDTFNEGFLSMTERFLNWSKTLESNQQWNEWLRFSQTVLPDVLTIVGELLKAFWEVHRVFAPITESVLGFVAAWMQANPELVKFLVVGFAVSQFFVGLVGLIAGLIVKLILFSLIFGRIGQVMVVARTASALWAAVLAGDMTKIAALSRTLFATLMKMSLVGRVWQALTLAMRGWAVAMYAVRAATAVAAAAQWLFNAALLANPITWVVLAIAALVAGAIWAYQNFQTFRDVVNGAWASIKSAWGSVVSFFKGVFDAVIGFFREWGLVILAVVMPVIGLPILLYQNWDKVVAFFAALPAKIAYGLGALAGWLFRTAVDSWAKFQAGLVQAFVATVAWLVALPGRIRDGLINLGIFLATVAVQAWDSFTNGLIQAFVNTVAWFVGLPDRIARLIVDIGSWLATDGADLWEGFKSGMVTGWVNVVAWFAALPARIQSFFVDAAVWLVTTGAQVWEGFRSGLAGAVVGMATWVMGIVDSFIQGFKDGLGIASPSRVFMEIGQWVIQGFIAGLEAAWNFVYQLLTGLVQGFISYFLGGFESLASGFAAVWRGITAQFQLAWALIQTVGMTAWNLLQSFFLGGMRAFQAAFQIIWFGVQAVFSAAWRTMQAIGMAVWTAISSFFQLGFQTFRALFQAVWSLITAIFTGNWTQMRVAAVQIWTIIQNFFTQAFAIFRNMFQTVWNAIVAFFQFTWNTLRSVATTAWGILSGFFSSAFSAFSSFFRSTWDGIVATFDRVWSAVIDIAKRVWEGVRAAFVGGVNVIIDVINGFAGAINKVAGLLGFNINLGIPRLAQGGEIEAVRRKLGGEIVMKQVIHRAKGGGIDATGGGKLPSTGKPYDSIPARAGAQPYLLMGNEWIVRASSSKSLGPTQMSMINNADRNPVDVVPRGMWHPDTAARVARYASGGELAAAAQRGVPGTRVTSLTRPGAAGYHGRGQAADLAGPRSMDTAFLHRINQWIATNHGKATSELIFTPGINLLNGRNHNYNAATRADHNDHVHWAMAGPLAGGQGGEGWFSGVINWIKDQASALLNPLRDRLRPIKDNNAEIFPKRMVAGVGLNLIDYLFKKSDEADAAMASAGGGAGVEQWRGVVMQALTMMSQPHTLADTTLRRMNQESGGNPRAINNWDSNARKGTPSKGLMQVIDPTFATHRDPRAPNDIWNPLSNILASMRYAMSRYGSLSAAYNRAGGYDVGGVLGQGMTLVRNMLPHSETVIPLPPEMVDNLLKIGSKDLDPIVVDSGRVADNTRRGNDGGSLVALARAIAAEVRDQAPLVGSINVPVEDVATAREAADEVVFQLRSAKRGGAHTGGRAR